MKWSQIKRVISLTLCVMMVLALLPTSTLAEDAAPAETSAPVETATAEPTAAETTAPVVDAAPTPAPDSTDTATPAPSETPVESIVPEGPVTYLVNFVVDGETKTGLQQTVAEGETAKAPSIPAVPEGEAYVGQVFLYWYARENTPYDFSTPVTANLTLYAQFGLPKEEPATEEDPAIVDEGPLFSAFSMAGGILPETTPLWTFTFVVGGTTVSTKIIANGDTLDNPEVPTAPDGQKFSGWYTDANTLFDSFGVQTVTVDGATTLTAKFEPAYSVFFYNQFGSVFMTVTPDASNIVTMPNSAELKVAADEAVVGWSLTPGGTTDVGSSVTVNGANINLYPIIQKVIWISFNSVGGTYLAPMYIQPNTKLTLAAVEAYIATQNSGSSTISKVGYTFTGWTGFNFGQKPSSNVTLTAGWTPQTVGYTVLFWQQAVVGDSYAVVAADTVESRTALSGSTVSPASGDTTKSYKGFNYNATKSVSVTVNGDGSTVLNVYYDRQTWTVNWQMRSKTGTGGYNPVFGSEVVTIHKRVVALTTENASKMYDGTALTNPNWNYDSTGNDGFVAGQGFSSATANGTITNVDTADNTFAYTLNGLTAAANYTINVTKGKLTITASNALTVDATDVSHMYDGTPYGVSASANVPTDTTIRYSEVYSADPADYILTTSPTATHVDDTRTVYFVATNANYQPAFGDAKVTITPRHVVVNVSSATRIYNGLALSANGWLLDSAFDSFVGSEGFATSATTGSITNVGTASNGFTYTLKSNTRATDYDISVEPGVLEVTPRTVMIAAVDSDKNFGSADPVFGYTVLTGNIGGTTYYTILPADLAGITVTINRTGADSDVGTYAGVLVPDVNATAPIQANYAFTTQNAALTINPQVVYDLNTTDTVTGFPQTQWFDLGTNAVIASADGVKRPGYRLTGWEDATTGTPIALGGSIPAISRNHTLNAVWEVALYDVIYESGTIEQVDRMPANIADKAYKTPLTVADNIPYLSGYGFLYWVTTGIDGTEKQLAPGAAFTMPDNDLVLTAVFEPRTSPIYYHANGASGGTVEGGRFFTDSLVTVEGNMFSRPGYRFLGWSERSATAGVSQQPGNTIVMPPRQINYYAQWEKLSFTVTYIVSGGTGNLDGNTPYAVYTDLSYGDAMPIPTNPTLNGYTFEGWTTAIPATVPDGDLVIYGTMEIVGQDDDPERVPDEQTPLAGGPVWALLNLILTIATALASIVMLIGLFGKKKEERDGQVIRETEKHPVTRMLTLLPGIGAIIAFILTENMRNPMVFTDRWTLLMAIIALVQLVLVVFGAKKDKEPDYDKLSSAPKAE